MTDFTNKSWMVIGETDDPNAILQSFEAAVDITKGSPVYLSADNKVSPSPGGDDSIGIAAKTVLSTQMCPVFRRGRVKVKADGAITRGKAVCSAADGKVSQLVDQQVNEGGATNYTIFYNRKLGTALQSTTADGDLLFVDLEK